MFLCPRDVWFYLFALICISIWRQFGLGVHHTLSTGQWRRPGLAQQEQVLFLFPRWRWLHLAHGAGAGELQLWEFLFCRRWSTKSFGSTNCRFSSSLHVQAKIRCARAGQIEMRMSKSKWDAHAQAKMRCAWAGKNEMRNAQAKMRGAWAGKNEMCMRRHKWDAHVQVKLRCACAGQNKMRTRSCKWQQHQQQYLLSTKKFTSVGVKVKLYKKKSAGHL